MLDLVLQSGFVMSVIMALMKGVAQYVADRACQMPIIVKSVLYRKKIEMLVPKLLIQALLKRIYSTNAKNTDLIDGEGLYTHVLTIVGVSFQTEQLEIGFNVLIDIGGLQSEFILYTQKVRIQQTLRVCINMLQLQVGVWKVGYLQDGFEYSFRYWKFIIGIYSVIVKSMDVTVGESLYTSFNYKLGCCKFDMYKMD
eukprot:TRINITY_DN16614_c0_g1_i1.p3 TRINITY_DN16614_c0_g1~~TRINITY_DN16614_c0_g1_i1.p3  ORF type:complete len:197 (-),score=9.04 TRINITY_DN16614_c0_g1_i1:404-994(-)